MENSTAFKDPVCGMAVTNKSFHQAEYMGQRFYFCGTKCKAKFAANLARYTDEAAPPSGFATTQVTGNEAKVTRRRALHPAWMLLLATLAVLVVGGFLLA